MIGIAGGSGSGKSTFARKIITRLKNKHVIHLHQDSYYLPTQPKDHFVKGKPNFDHPDSFDWPLLRSHLKELKEGRSISAPVYDFNTSSRLSETEDFQPSQICLFDGIYALWDEEVRSHLDLKIFLHVDADIRFIRRLHRDVRERGRSLDSIISQYYDTVRPMHSQFLEPTSKWADIQIGEETDIPAEVIASQITHVLNERKKSG